MLPTAHSVKIMAMILACLGASCVKRQFNSAVKIAGGALVEESDPVYTSTVSLDSSGKPYCGGFVFDKRTIVTSARCLVGHAGVIYTVTFGSNQKQLKKSVEVPARQALAHPEWDREDLTRKNIEPIPSEPKNDIGVLVLSEDAPDWVKPLPLSSKVELKAGADLILAGYGQTNTNRNDPSGAEFGGYLREVGVKLAAVNEVGKELIWESKESNSPAGSCQGDAGGPVFDADNNGELTVMGVNSRAFDSSAGCKGKGILTDVRKFTEWILAAKAKLLSGVVQTGDWVHRSFEAKEGSRVSIDYTLESAGADYLATEVWLNVTHPDFTGEEKVTAKLSSYINSLTQQTVTLQWAGQGRFTGKFDKFAREKVCAIASRWGIKQDFVVQVNGKSLTDAATGSEAFIFKFCE
ncbi:MAG: hypothetical protein RIR26_2175 [Pseudomonadota bacterium]|jgi:hypothetical protein